MMLAMSGLVCRRWSGMVESVQDGIVLEWWWKRSQVWVCVGGRISKRKRLVLILRRQVVERAPHAGALRGSAARALVAFMSE